MPGNWAIIKKGPVVPTGVNQKSFLSVKIAQMDNHTFKNGQVAKMTAGKIRLRNEEEKSFTNDNSEYAEKDDIIEFTGAVYAANESRDDHASCRVFTSNNYKPTKEDKDKEKKK